MLLDDNTNQVIELLDNFDLLKNIDKIRLVKYLLEDTNFNKEIEDVNIKCLDNVLSILDKNYNKGITNFSKYTTLLFLSTRYMELTQLEKKNFIIEILFNIYNNDFNNKLINYKIQNNLLVFEYYYSIFN